MGFDGPGGGGGSGYFNFTTISASETTGDRLLEVTVGAGQMESVVRLGGRVVLEAGPGADGEDRPGGAGYSGGGAGSDSTTDDGADGGSNGGDGGNSTYWAGGKGSGVDATTILVAGFYLGYVNVF